MLKAPILKLRLYFPLERMLNIICPVRSLNTLVRSCFLLLVEYTFFFIWICFSTSSYRGRDASEQFILSLCRWSFVPFANFKWFRNLFKNSSFYDCDIGFTPMLFQLIKWNNNKFLMSRKLIADLISDSLYMINLMKYLISATVMIILTYLVFKVVTLFNFQYLNITSFALPHCLKI